MAFDAAAIRKKLAELSGKDKQKNIMWRPEVGKTYTVRIIALPGASDGSPFRELYFYYGIGNNPGILTLKQFGKPDPVQELIVKLRSEDTKEGYEQAKKLYPKMRAYAAIIVRGHEADGVKLWSFGKTVYQQLLGYLVDPEYGDITDLKEGFDIRVSVEQNAGKQFADTTVSPRRTPSKLSEDPAQVKLWLDSLPNLDEMYTCKSYDEVSKILNDWLHPDKAEVTDVPHGKPVSAKDDDDDDDEKPVIRKSTTKKVDDVFAELDDID